jgi:hypothetical protein
MKLDQLLNWISDTRDWLYDRLSIRCLLCHRTYFVLQSCEHGYTIAAVVAAVVAAAAAGASTYMASEQQAQQARDQRKMADWQQRVEAEQAEAARKQVQLRAQRHLNAQAAKAGGAGVVSGEGSLLIDQLEAASLSQYEEDLAAYGHQMNSATHGFESKLFKRRESEIRANQGWQVGLATGSSLLSSYSSYSGKTIATQKPEPSGGPDVYGTSYQRASGGQYL